MHFLRSIQAALLAAFALLPASRLDAAGLASFQDKRCGVKFVFPANWDLTIAFADETTCALELRPPEAQDVVIASPGSADEPCHVGLIHVRIVATSLEKLAAEHGFSRVKGEWRYRVGTIFAKGRAETLSGTGWNGLRGKGTSLYCGSPQTTYAFVLGHSTRAMSIDLHAEKLLVVEEILRSLRVSP